MNKRAKSIWQAAGYIGIYLAVQVAVSTAYVLRIIVGLFIDTARYGALNDATIMQWINTLQDQINTILVISGVLTLLVLWLVFVIQRKKMFYEIGFEKPILFKHVLLCLGMGLFAQLGVNGVLNLIPIPQILLNFLEQTNAPLVEGPMLMQILSLIVVAPILEEVIFRGLILSRLQRGFSARSAILLSSLVFGLVHVNFLGILYAFALGLLLGFVFVRTRNIGNAIVLHMAFNAGSFLMAYSPDMWWVYAVSIVISAAVLFYLLRVFNHSTGGSAIQAASRAQDM